MARLMQVFLFHSFANLSLKTNSIIQPCSSQNTGLQNANPDYNQSHSCCTCSDSVGRIVQSRVQKDVWSVLCRCQVRRSVCNSAPVYWIYFNELSCFLCFCCCSTVISQLLGKVKYFLSYRKEKQLEVKVPHTTAQSLTHTVVQQPLMKILQHVKYLPKKTVKQLLTTLS